jgi:hypothetical protein
MSTTNPFHWAISIRWRRSTLVASGVNSSLPILHLQQRWISITKRRRGVNIILCRASSASEGLKQRSKGRKMPRGR